MKKAPEVTLDLDAMERAARLRIQQTIDYSVMIARESIRFRAKTIRIGFGLTRVQPRVIAMSPLLSHPHV